MRLLVLVAVVCGALLLRELPIGAWLTGAERWVEARPIAGALAYIVATIVAVVALTPGWIPMMLAGLLFGLGPGLVYGLIGITAGATAALIAGRTLARQWVERRIADNPQMLALDDALEEQAFTIVALTRVALVIPFNMLNYAYGLTRVGTATYASATAIGMLPIVAMYVYLGTLARDIGAILAGEGETGASTYWVAGVALTVIAIIVVVIRRAVARALAKRTATDVDMPSDLS